ncbi:transcription termination/antitermination protein NusG [Dichelobacter nodosus]|uniref:Transcription termination/antitermination protein NusG n=1 Tax=Dichelobacter nodosus (strain VCS1703A) TaxID=246195 RepID=A5EX75_DICNV|nr:transcription termination/antitermination protein NusG [Dichelobacter nodosus]ABQ13565.1 transcription termination-antitermination factor NusG [Dichelobacter nodosus VCS1703A]KNZ39527.1 antitermination protein NusG [Dichelobacter nodosus]TGA65386.1 transcription termination/antitermination protein NusG [Dichelobacter nodosus]
MAKQWYVLQSYSQFEQYVKRALQERIEREGLQDSFGEILIPTEEVVEIKDNKKRISQHKFYPGYVFVEMEMNDTTWHVVNSIPKVSGFVGGTKESPAAISQEEVDKILNRMQEGVEKPRPKTLFEIGEELRIIDGPFADFTGTVEEVNYEKSRLKVSVLIFGRPTPVELEFNQVEKEI